MNTNASYQTTSVLSESQRLLALLGPTPKNKNFEQLDKESSSMASFNIASKKTSGEEHEKKSRVLSFTPSAKKIMKTSKGNVVSYQNNSGSPVKPRTRKYRRIIVESDDEEDLKKHTSSSNISVSSVAIIESDDEKESFHGNVTMNKNQIIEIDDGDDRSKFESKSSGAFSVYTQREFDGLQNDIEASHFIRPSSNVDTLSSRYVPPRSSSMMSIYTQREFDELQSDVSNAINTSQRHPPSFVNDVHQRRNEDTATSINDTRSRSYSSNFTYPQKKIGGLQNDVAETFTSSLRNPSSLEETFTDRRTSNYSH